MSFSCSHVMWRTWVSILLRVDFLKVFAIVLSGYMKMGEGCVILWYCLMEMWISLQINSCLDGNHYKTLTIAQVQKSTPTFWSGICVIKNIGLELGLWLRCRLGLGLGLSFWLKFGIQEVVLEIGFRVVVEHRGTIYK